MRPLIALVGRPNVGKSTLFNRLVGRRQAIVAAEPGLTRDRLYGVTEWRDRELAVVDTAGLFPEQTYPPPTRKGEGIYGSSQAQTKVAISEADVILFIVDARTGLTPTDRDIAALLRRSGRPVVVVANKVDEPKRTYFEHELLELGLGEVVRVSSQHGINVDELLDKVLATVDSSPTVGEESTVAARIAIMGRPNVGKSSMLNRLLGDERVVVSEIPGTTRDPVDTEVQFSGLPLTLVDTAGIRRRVGARDQLEHFSLLRGLQVMERSDVVLLVIEAQQGVLRQDQHVASYALEAGRGLVVVVNKIDLVERSKQSMEYWQGVIRKEFKFAPYLPTVICSANSGEGIEQVLPTAMEVAGQREVRIPTGELNRLLQELWAVRPPPSYKGKRLKLKYATQADSPTPTIVLFVNDVGLLHWSYRRYLENRLRRCWSFVGNPLRLVLRT